MKNRLKNLFRRLFNTLIGVFAVMFLIIKFAWWIITLSMTNLVLLSGAVTIVVVAGTSLYRWITKRRK